MFIQVPHKVQYGDAEKSALETIASAAELETRSTPLISDVEGLSRSLDQTLNILDRVSDWVNGIIDEDEQPNNALGQFLMNALSLSPKVDAAQIEHDFNNHIQDVLMVSYLANAIRTQIDLSQKLATSTITLGDKDGENKTGESGDKGDQRGGQRGGKRGGRGGGRGGGQQREPKEPREPREQREPAE